ncbi:hypothetical protein [Streptomyces prasinopilosus]|uniref:hypothetical protein n=1 Tax=Streptomyces prasinopilosus TaxID=67344 RepID=UPI0006EB3C43|nr:hypothetical protein [Streptomyces prasinopilosus]
MSVLTPVRGEATREHADALADAAGSALPGGSGVAGAIRRRGGAGHPDAVPGTGRAVPPPGPA